MSYQLDMLGKPLRRSGPAAPAFTGDLFEGAAWTWAAEQWAKEQGLRFEGWTIARRFKAGGRWWAVRWDVRPVIDVNEQVRPAFATGIDCAYLSQLGNNPKSPTVDTLLRVFSAVERRRSPSGESALRPTGSMPGREG